MLTAREIAQGLKKSRKTSDGGYIACCPAHDDKNPSLSITEKDGKILLHCHAGCVQSEVISSLTNMGLWPDKKLKKDNNSKHINVQKRNNNQPDFNNILGKKKLSYRI